MIESPKHLNSVHFFQAYNIKSPTTHIRWGWQANCWC